MATITVSVDNDRGAVKLIDPKMASKRPRRVLVVGAGPVGALTALSLRRRGWEVEIWDSRDGEQLYDYDEQCHRGAIV